MFCNLPTLRQNNTLRGTPLLDHLRLELRRRQFFRCEKTPSPDPIGAQEIGAQNVDGLGHSFRRGLLVMVHIRPPARGSEGGGCN